MKRGGPITRKTPMKRTALPRTTGLRREKGRTPNPPKRRAAKRRGLRRPTMDPALRQAVFVRACGICDRCGIGLNPDAWECHHRKLRSRGGKDSFENLVALCSGCHHWAHHNNTHATDRGFIVPSWLDPAHMPVWRHDRAWWLPVGPSWHPPEFVTFE